MSKPLTNSNDTGKMRYTDFGRCQGMHRLRWILLILAMAAALAACGTQPQGAAEGSRSQEASVEDVPSPVESEAGAPGGEEAGDVGDGFGQYGDDSPEDEAPGSAGSGSSPERPVNSGSPKYGWGRKAVELSRGKSAADSSAARQAYGAGTPGSVAARFLEALRQMDPVGLAETTGEDVDYYELDDEPETMLLTELMSRMQYTVMGETVSGDAAHVKLSVVMISAVNMRDEVTERLAQLIAMGVAPEDILLYLEGRLKEPDAATVTIETALEVTKDQHGKWIIDMESEANEEFFMDITEDWITFFEEISYYLGFLY